MTDEEKKAQDEKEAQEAKAKEDLAAAEKVAKEKKDKEELSEKVANLEFDNALKDQAKTYPHAEEFKDKIRERVKAGMSVEEATAIVLHKEGKLETREQVESASAAQGSMGGSADFVPPPGKKKPGEMTTEELRAALVEEERKGTFFNTPD